MTSGTKESRELSPGVDRAAAILSVAYPYAPIGPLVVGGAEVICSQMEAAVGALGFRSVVVAHAASQTEGKLYGTEVPPGTITDEVRAAVEAAQQANIDRSLAEQPIALVHMHGLDFPRYRIPEDVPVLVTLHLPPGWYPESIWDLPSNYHLVCVSEAQRRACPEAVRSRVTVVENGVPIPCSSTLRPQGRYALMLARICPEKNLHAGLDAARLAGMPVLLGGEVFPYETHQQYFHEQIEPRLSAQGAEHEGRGQARADVPTARFVGAVSREEKTRVLSKAACLLLPSLAPETSSLVAMEALAAGVPVIGMRVGAVPEIVEHGWTGFLVTPGDGATEEMAAAIGRLGELDRNICRRVAEERFPLSRMVDGYAALYRSFAVAPTRRSSAQRTHEIQDRAKAVDGDELRSSDVVAEAIHDEAALFGLAADWAELWNADGTATPFQHPAWLLPWWRQFGPDGALQAFAWRDKDRRSLVGVVPVYTYRQPETGLRQLLLIGAGTSDYLDGVWSPRCRALPELSLQRICESREGWDVASMQQVRADSPLKSAAEQRGLKLASAEPVSLIDVAAELPAKIRANVNRYRRRVEKRGGYEFGVASSSEEALALFEALAEFHRARWDDRGLDGVLGDPRVVAQHCESIPELFRAGLLRMFRLSFVGKVVGVMYALADPEQRTDRRLYLYLIGFDSELAEFSPGTLLLREVWQYARENGFSTLDLLRGGESYKALWGARSEETFAIQLP